MNKKPFPIVCRLSASSAKDLAEIEQECNRPPWDEALFAKEFKNHHAFIYGVRTSGQLVGFLVCHIVMDEAHIVNFGVRESFRGKGLGRALISEVLNELNAEAVRWVTLEVRQSNQPALYLYKSLGFYEAGLRAKYYSDNGEDALLMRANLQGIDRPQPIMLRTQIA